MDWSTHFPAFVASDQSDAKVGKPPAMVREVEVADVGCGFGGLLVALAPLLPDKLMIGMCIFSLQHVSLLSMLSRIFCSRLI